MITIHISVHSKSSGKFNDSVVPGLAHHMISAALGKERFRFTRFIIEENSLEILDKDFKIVSTLKPVKNDKNANHSSRFKCMRMLLDNMTAGDLLKATNLSDLGIDALEAEQMYFMFLEKGINLSFYECSHLNTQLHHLKRIPSNDQKAMIINMIEDYYSKYDNLPELSKDESHLLAEISGSEKK